MRRCPLQARWPVRGEPWERIPLKRRETRFEGGVVTATHLQSGTVCKDHDVLISIGALHLSHLQKIDERRAMNLGKQLGVKLGHKPSESAPRRMRRPADMHLNEVPIRTHPRHLLLLKEQPPLGP